MLFHPPKNPVELRVIHLNKNQKQRRDDLKEAMENDDEDNTSLKQQLAKKLKPYFSNLAIEHRDMKPKS